MSLPMSFTFDKRAEPTIGWTEPRPKARPGPLQRALGVAAGGALVAAGAVIAPLPGPFGVPVMAAGTAVILKNSRRAKRLFVTKQKQHPRVLTPLRKVMKRPMSVVSVSWLQALRLERLAMGKGRERVLARKRRELARRLLRGRMAPA